LVGGAVNFVCSSLASLTVACEGGLGLLVERTVLEWEASSATVLELDDVVGGAGGCGFVSPPGSKNESVADFSGWASKTSSSSEEFRHSLARVMNVSIFVDELDVLPDAGINEAGEGFGFAARCVGLEVASCKEATRVTDGGSDETACAA
jgi:hypothetical protein